MTCEPQLVIILSGKRKSGKDHTAAQLQRLLGADRLALLRLSEPLKAQYARDHGLDLQRLMDASEYKERYREDMIRWGEAQRRADPGFFCRQVAQQTAASRPVWLIPDARRVTDLAYFQEQYQDRVVTARVEAGEEVRAARGWVFTPGVDDAESECGLDRGVTWTYLITNNGDDGTYYDKLMQIADDIRQRLGH